MKDLKEREQEARERLAEQLKRLRREMASRRPVAGGALRVHAPRPVPEAEQPSWWWQR